MRRRPRRAIPAAWLAAAVTIAASAGCSEPELKAAGEPCVAAAECLPGLVCDFGAPTPVCAGNITTDARVIDAALDARVFIDAAVDAAVDAAIDAALP
jgi:hypothetical protein